MNRILSTFLSFVILASVAMAAKRPNVVLVMADDQGWGQTGYYNHPVLKTPNLDAMAANGLRFDRFYAGGPVCSPTRASVLTGRTHDRTGVYNHGYPLRLQEKTLPAAMKAAGYATGHFGKWHLNGLRGPGVPILEDDTHSPGAFGFDTWLSVTNFFDMDPLLSRKGKFEDFKGDSSEIVVEEGLKFMRKKVEGEQPFFAVIWYGTPHSPFKAFDEDKVSFKDLDEKSADHYGELVAMDRSIGTLRKGLEEMGVKDDTLFWFCSDNGGLNGINPGTVGGLRGFKGTMYEGGLRVPGIIEWPAGIQESRITRFPAGVVDMFPTLISVCGLSCEAMLNPQDGMDLSPLFRKEIGARDKPLVFRHNGRHAVIENQWKILSPKGKGKSPGFEVYNLDEDKGEEFNLFDSKNEVSKKLVKMLENSAESIASSDAGNDYPEGEVSQPQPPRMFWRDQEEYKKHFPKFEDRWEYERWMKKK